MRKQAASMSNIIYDNEYGLWFPGGIDEYHLHIIARYTGVLKESSNKWIFYFNGRRVRTPTEGSSHPCWNCGHCVDNMISTCGNKNCIRDRRRRRLCNNENWDDRGKAWIHTFTHTYHTTRKGVVYIHGHCNECLKKFKWLGDYQQDYHVVLFNLKFGTSSKHKTMNTYPRTAIGELRHECLKRDSFKCRDCGIHKDESPLEVDHIIPYSKGGLTELDNLQTLCKKCNRSKHTRTWRGGE